MDRNYSFIKINEKYNHPGIYVESNLNIYNLLFANLGPILSNLSTLLLCLSYCDFWSRNPYT